MFESLNDIEKEIAMLLLRGQTCKGIMEWLEIDYYKYKEAKRSLLKKLKLKRITEILPLAIQENQLF